MQRIGFLKALHMVASPLLKRSGFRWESRRQGDLKLGFWRKNFRKLRKARRFVLIPGFGDTPLSWLGVVACLMPTLRRQFDEVVLLDFPGFQGFLSQDRAIPSIDLFMQISHDLLDSLTPHTIFGHSLGAWVTGAYASRCGSGERPRSQGKEYQGPARVIFASPSGLFGDPANLNEWQNRFQLARQEGFEAYRPLLFAREPAWFRLIAPAFMGFFAKTEITEFMDSFRKDHLLDDALTDLKCESWLLWGSKDRIVPPDLSRVWLAAMKQSPIPSRAVILKNIGHSPHLENPVLTAAVIAQVVNAHWRHGIPAASPFRLFCLDRA